MAETRGVETVGSPRGGGFAGPWPPVLLGALLRLLAAVVSAPTPGDDVGRMSAACRWSLHPEWLGLSGIWPPLPAYLLGSLIRLGGSAVAWAHALGWITSTAALPLLYLAVRELYGDARRAALATWMLAIYYVHIWMAGTAYVETPYVALLFACLWSCARAVHRTGAARDRAALAAGIAMALALLFRHEAKLVSVILLVWLARGIGVRATLRYAIPALGVLAWQLVEPSLLHPAGGGFAHDASIVAGMKIAEVTLHGSRLDALSRWIVMPAGSPSLIVLALAVAGVWMARGTWGRDPWLWLFAGQSAVFLALTIYPGWQPYLRYIFLYVVCLLPHAARALDAVGRRRPAWVALALVLTVGLQAVAWSRGRNDGRPLGWLPVYRAAPQQVVLDTWIREHLARDRVLSLEGYPQEWDAYASAMATGRCDLIAHLRSVSYDQKMALAKGGVLNTAGYDVMIFDPSSRSYRDAEPTFPRGYTVEHRDEKLAIVRLRR
jgi:hypothetical protein